MNVEWHEDSRSPRQILFDNCLFALNRRFEWKSVYAKGVTAGATHALLPLVIKL